MATSLHVREHAAIRTTHPAPGLRAPIEVIDSALSGGSVRTPRLVLRMLRADDREAFIDTIRESRAALDAHAPLHRPNETDDQLFDRQLALTDEGERTGKAWRRVAVLDSGHFVGGFNVNAISRGLASEGVVNAWLDVRHHGHGYATEALGALIDIAMLDLPRGLGLTTLRGGIKPDNAASIKLATRLGFKPDHELSESYLEAGGQWSRHLMYRIDAV